MTDVLSMYDVREGHCREVMATLDAGSVDAIVTDPPYGLSFMGKEWDHGVPGVPFWVEALRVAKPGAHLVAFGGTRTYHRLACAIEDAGWEIRDGLMWLYGSGFPKSLDVGKAIDKAAGAEREIVGPSAIHSRGAATSFPKRPGERTAEESGRITPQTAERAMLTAPATDAAKQWDGWGTALKPAYEPIILARKPLSGTVAANVQEHGTGALNIDGCRVEYQGEADKASATLQGACTSGALAGGGRHDVTRAEFERPELKGRWPANLVLDEEAARLLDEQSGECEGPGGPASKGSDTAWPGGATQGTIYPGQRGGASRFFYTAKASSGERHYAGKNAHPTVKPVDLMRWLVRLVTPPGGLVLDPFTGSGSTGVAALAEGARFLGIELDPEHVATARRRIAGPLFA